MNQGSRQRTSAPRHDARTQFQRPAPRNGGSGTPTASKSLPWLIGGCGVLVLIGMVSGGSGPDEALPTEPVAAFSPAAVAPAPMLPSIDASDVHRADQHAELAIGAEGASGAMVYSVNCWAAVSRSFSLAALDRCGAFDALAGRVHMDPLELPAEADWFQAAEANHRYSIAATTGGIDTTAAAERYGRVLELAELEVLEPRVSSVPSDVEDANNQVLEDIDEPVDEVEASLPGERSDSSRISSSEADWATNGVAVD